jgi:two-component system cell cycle response regulator DivK
MLVNKGAFEMTTIQESGSDPPIRILLLEDDESNRRLMQDFLLYSGCEVFALSEGRQLPVAIASFKPQVILLDLRLPDIDGYDLLAQIRADPSSSRIPIIVISALAFQRDRDRALEMGVQRYMVKPIRLLDVMAAIREVIAS